MRRSMEEKLTMLDEMSAKDRHYQTMLQENRDLELRFQEVLHLLPKAQQDAAWDFVMQCEDMSRYVLELACTYMDFLSE